MIIIDGSEGEGGGQILRTSLALSLITAQPFRIENIRAKRDKPGLMRQHATCVEAAAIVGNAEVEGLAVGASAITFHPGQINAGHYNFAVGTAGSTGLVLQTILLPLMRADGPSEIVIEGGTHNLGAPPFDFIERSFIPCLRKMGATVEARLVRHGFYPRGGGKIIVEITPAELTPADMQDRGVLARQQALILNAAIPDNVPHKERKTLIAKLEWPEDTISIRTLPEERGPGNVILLEAKYEHVTEIVTGFAKLGKPAQQLAKQAAARMSGYQAGDAFAGPYLADQLLIPMALAGGGSFTTVKPSQHLLTNVDIIGRFLPVKFDIRQQENGAHLVCAR